MKDIILPIVFIALGALLVFLVVRKPEATKKETTRTPQPTDVPTFEQSQQVPPWILLNNAVSKYTA